MRTISAAFLILMVAPWPAAAQAAQPAAALAAARAHYNAGRAAEALAQLQPIIVRPGEPASAAVVAARALLERYRASTDPAYLATAREHLRAIDPSALAAADRRDLLVGLAEALYLEESFAASALMFESALDPAGSGAPFTGAAREQVLDWWATALDRHAQLKPQAERRLVYARIAERMERETREFPGSAPAAYWLAAAARGAGDLERAWAASIAGWVRASMMRDRGAALRADLDRLMQQALIPERSRALSLSGKEAEQAAAGMLAEWELIKKNWSR